GLYRVPGGVSTQYGGLTKIKTVGHLQPSFPRGRESRPVGAETYREKRFLEILRLGFPLLWE
ncbi:TPA: hypothetical protein ACFIR0_002138, partial [Neisseria gonorrhoeae]